MKRQLFFYCIMILSIAVGGCHSDAQEENGHEALDALRFLGAGYSFPAMDVPPDAMGRAYDYFKQHYNTAQSRVNTTATWRNIGPSNVGGRTLSIAIDPSDTAVVWLGSASGGLWKSTCGGIGPNAWHYVPTGFPVLGVASIAINPQNTQELYIGTGETYSYGTSQNGIVIRTTRGSHGIGLLKSSDGGASWNQVLNWSYNQQRTVWDILVNPLRPNSVVIGTTEGIYTSYDGGGSWTQTLPYTMVMDLEMKPGDTSVVFAGVGNLTSTNKGLYRSTNGGQSWSLLTNGLPSGNSGRISVSCHPQFPDIVMAHVTDDFNTIGMYRSRDGGNTFSTMSTGTNIAGVQGWYAHGLLMSATDTNRMFIAGQLLWASNDAGANPFQAVNYNPNDQEHTPWPDIHAIVSNPLDPNKVYLLTDAGLYRSNDFGNTWFSCYDGYVVAQYYTGDVSSTDTSIAIGGLQDRGTQVYSGSSPWTLVPNGDGTTTVINPTNDFIQYTSSQYLNVYQSTNRGIDFNNYVYGGTNAAFTAPYVLAPTNPQVMYAGDEFVNRIDLNSFSVVSNPTPTGQPLLSIAVSHQLPQKLYYTTAPSDVILAGVFKSTNGGTSSLDITHQLPNRYAREIAVNPLNDEIAYVAFSGFGSGHIFRTNNGGGSWYDISTTLPDMPFHCLWIDPSDTAAIYAGCDFGVFRSGDGGASWQTLNIGLPEAVMIFDLKYSPADHHLVAFTHGHGVYKIDLQSLSTGVVNPAASLALMLFPQPATDYLNVNVDNGIATGTELIVLSIEGKICLRENAPEKSGSCSLRLDLSGLPAGIYYLTTKDHRFVRRFVKT